MTPTSHIAMLCSPIRKSMTFSSFVTRCNGNQGICGCMFFFYSLMYADHIICNCYYCRRCRRCCRHNRSCYISVMFHIKRIASVWAAISGHIKNLNKNVLFRCFFFDKYFYGILGPVVQNENFSKSFQRTFHGIFVKESLKIMNIFTCCHLFKSIEYLSQMQILFVFF